ncbi:replication initiation factor domain-containing protein [Fischerella sp. NIES-3754]|uniref:replication initiation factor domain-containing protein n=1 Tax=Fischerella sp. NIES-3754 TaxID=1752063 RepID=UPI000721C0E5|nr:replication initiation factor domain-containing protein [Fischerella sp. NIES-3754]BAU09056.1 hypothetical protein FIS3754_50180 [Fischerella sp. NIES-3754]
MIAKNSTQSFPNLLAPLEFNQRGSSDTPSYPEYHYENKDKPYIRTNDDRVFIDYLKFFGSDLALSSYHECLLIELFLRGKFFAVSEYPDRDSLEVSSFDCYSQIHEGSLVRWTKVYRNSIGVVLKIAYPSDESGRFDSSRVVAICLEFSGTPLSQLIPRNNQIVICQIIDVLTELSSKIRVTRIDTTLEFSREKLDLFEVREAIDNENVMGLENYFSISGKNKKNIGKTITCYFGSFKSDKVVRLYDTENKHGYCGVRFEVQNRRKYANLVVVELMHIYKSAIESPLHPCNELSGMGCDLRSQNDKINQFIIDYNLSRKNFVLTNKKDKKRWQNRWQVKELEFWSKFKKSFKVNELKYQFIKEDLPIKSSIKHFVRNFSGLLCGLYDSLGSRLFDSLLKAIMVAKKKGIGMGLYKGTEQKYLELSELASDGILGICDDYLLSVFHAIGLFRMPSHLPSKNKRTILKDEPLRLNPRLNIGLEF